MEKIIMSIQKNGMLFIWFLKFGIVTPRDDYSVHDYVKAKFCPEYMSAEELDGKEQLLRDTPGPAGIKYAYFVGNKVNGTIGALCAVIASLLPVLIITAALFYAYPSIARLDAPENLNGSLMGGAGAATLGLIVAHIIKITHFNKFSFWDKRPLIIIVISAGIFLFLPQYLKIGVAGSNSTMMPIFIVAVIIVGIALGVIHGILAKRKASRPPKYIDPYSKKAKKMRDRQLFEEEWKMRKYRDDDTFKKRRKELEEEAERERKRKH
jgi:chromate transporter